MILKECMLIKNACYIHNKKITNGKPTGIVVHSTGANNKTLKRYVQPILSQPYYNEVIADLGKNIYSNHWNNYYVENNRSCCVHAFIGVNATGQIETYQTLPFDICCWGCASGSKGSYNYNPNARIQFEICEDNLNDCIYFDSAFKEAIEFCVYLCKRFEFGADKICSHREAYLAGYGNNHGDCDHWLKRFGKNMDWFRGQVKSQLNEENNTHNRKSIEELAQEAIDGKWGNGAARKNALTSAGYNYSKVQKRVNEILRKRK